MNDARRYRLNAADCLSAANTCHSDRSLLLSIAGSWYALARQDEATRDLLASWGMAEPMTLNGLDHRPSSGPPGAPAPEPQRPTATLPT